MNRGAARLPTFLARSDGSSFERLLELGHLQFGVEVHAYCLMTNHFHLLVNCPSGGLSAFMQHVSGNYTRIFNERHGRDGPLFRGRFHSIPVNDGRYVMNAARYIHRNPLAIRPAVDLATYRWSSHGVYVGQRPRPAWLRTDEVLQMFSGGVASYRECVEAEHDTGRLPAPPELLLEFLDLVAAELSVGENRSPRLSRTIALALLERSPAPMRTALEASLGYADPSDRAEAARRARKRVDSSAELGNLIEQISRRAA